MWHCERAMILCFFSGHNKESFDNVTKPFFDTVEEIGIP